MVDFTRALGHDNDAVAHIDCLVDVVRNQEHRGAVRLPQAQHFILHAHASEGIQGTKWFIEKENSGMVNECAGQSDSLGHTAGKMVRVGVGECLEAYNAHEFVDLRTLLAKYAARDQPGLDVAPDGKPRK